MKKLALALALLMPLAACTNAEKGAVIGGVGGAALGTAAGGNDTRNAIVGGAVGAIAGALIGNAMDRNGNRREGYCEYRARNGRTYVDRCPSGY
jgi:uncharacterized protein YcfJ